MPNRLFIIDAHGLCYRAYYAVKALTNSKGQATNAVFGFCNILRKLLRDLNPTHIAVCFDVGKDTHRSKKFAEYKAQRQAMPDDLVSQMSIIYDLVRAFNIPIYTKEGYEADDMMASLAKRFAAKDTEVVIVTEDKDMSQLVGGPVKLYSARQEKFISEAEVVEKFGVAPSQITDYIAIAGDASDNIPGVFGIGEVGARKLIEQFGSIEGIYKRIDEVKPPKLQEKLIVGRDNALLSKDLATVHADVPIEVALDDLKAQEPNKKALVDLFTQLEFRKLVQEYAQDEVLFEALPGVLLDEAVDQEGAVTTRIVYDLKTQLKAGKVFNSGDKVFDVMLADFILAGGQGKYDVAQLRGSVEGMRQLFHIQRDLLKAEGSDKLYHEIELPLIDVLFCMESSGVQLDLEVLAQLAKEAQVKITQLEGQLHQIAGGPFNVNSPKQLSEILFERLKLPVIKKTKTGFSTDEEVLNRLADKHELPALILEYRQIAKLKSTYIDALPQLVDNHNRVHASFNQMGAETGRLSSNNPNLQNIPIRTELGRQIRRAFVPYKKDNVLLSADYSQIEIRILAHLADDANLKKAFAGDGDIHRYTASLMFDVPETEVDDKMRYAAKRINFGIIYGMSAFGLAKDLDVSQHQAQDFIDRYFLRYPKVKGFLDAEIQKARDLGYVETILHRRRYLPDINNRNIGLRNFAERQAINAPMQGTAADLIKLAMVNIAAKMSAVGVKSTMIMTVHDELVFDVPQDELKQMADLVRHEMEHAFQLSVPLAATVKVGRNWLEMEKI